MTSRTRRLARRALSVATPLITSAALLAPSQASAASYQIYNFDAYSDRINQYGGPITKTADYAYIVRYRWLDAPPTSVRVSTNLCSELDAFHYYDYGAGETGYHTVGQWMPGQCFVLRNRSLGFSFYNHDGNLLY